MQIWGTMQRAHNDYMQLLIFFGNNHQRLARVHLLRVCTYKINVDEATSKDCRPSGVGVVIRDCKSLVVVASAELLPAQYGLEVTEALAIEEGILLAR
nr:hypothetical protein CFP56_18254 [Quercus suber]